MKTNNSARAGQVIRFTSILAADSIPLATVRSIRNASTGSDQARVDQMMTALESIALRNP